MASLNCIISVAFAICSEVGRTITFSKDVFCKDIFCKGVNKDDNILFVLLLVGE